MRTLPSSKWCLDLSLRKAVRDGHFDRSLRVAIRDYRHMVRLKMAKEPCGVTPWGVWEKKNDGLYKMTSSLNNRFLDTELSAPFLSQNEATKKAYDSMQDGRGITVSQSIAARQECRIAAQTFAIAAICHQKRMPIVSSRNTTLMRVKVCKAGNDATDELSYCYNYAEAKLSEALNEKGDVFKNTLLRHLSRKALCESERAAAQRDYFWAHPAMDDIIGSSLRQYIGRKTQRVFIDLPTLALMSSNFLSTTSTVSSVKKAAEAWVFWVLLSSMAGIPASVLSPHGKVDPQYPLSPSGVRFDPIFVILNGMWSLGAADGFEIVLTLDHPDKSRRGVYMTFELRGPGRDLIDRTLNGHAEGGAMLSSPLPEGSFSENEKDDLVGVFSDSKLQRRWK